MARLNHLAWWETTTIPFIPSLWNSWSFLPPLKPRYGVWNGPALGWQCSEPEYMHRFAFFRPKAQRSIISCTTYRINVLDAARIAVGEIAKVVSQSSQGRVFDLDVWLWLCAESIEELRHHDILPYPIN